MAEYLKDVYGDGYAPHPRLWNAMAMNGLTRPDLLDKQAAQAAWQAGEFARLGTSLSLKVDGIAGMWRLAAEGKFRVMPTRPAVKDEGRGREVRVDPKADERDWWLHRQCKSSKPWKSYKAIRLELDSLAAQNDWERLASDQGVILAVRRYIKRHGLKPSPQA